jgi:hypothetical protein
MPPSTIRYIIAKFKEHGIVGNLPRSGRPVLATDRLRRLVEPKAMLKLETVCLMPKLRRIALSLLPCSRHSERCEKWFCRLWTLEKTIRVPVTYKDGWVDIFIFSRDKSFV